MAITRIEKKILMQQKNLRFVKWNVFKFAFKWKKEFTFAFYFIHSLYNQCFKYQSYYDLDFKFPEK